MLSVHVHVDNHFHILILCYFGLKKKKNTIKKNTVFNEYLQGKEF